MDSLHLISLLLQYPRLEMVEAIGELRDRLKADPAMPQGALASLEPLMARLETSDIYASQEAYVPMSSCSTVAVR
jgi:nitrate reductase delta subunit